jgi:hypothetical protein
VSLANRRHRWGVRFHRPIGKAKQLSAQAPGQRAGGHNEARVVNEWQSTRSGRDTIDQTREGGECM